MVFLAVALILHSVTVPGTGLHVKLASQAGRPFDARDVRKDVKYLWSLGRFDDIRVEEPEPGALVFRATPRKRLVLRDARLTPHSYGIDLKLPAGTPIDPAGAREIARGIEEQLGLRVEETLVPRGSGKVDLKLHVIAPKEKPKPPDPSEGIKYEISKDLCRTLFMERRDAQHDGALDFAAHFNLAHGLSVSRGRGYRVRRIDFMGHHRISDSVVRRHLLLDEGAILDERLLRQSISRLNRSGLFEPIDGRHTLIARDEAAGVADVTLQLRERGLRAWNISGPWPLHGSVSARLPKWATYAASISMVGATMPFLGLPSRFIPIAAFRRPYIPGEGWKSGFWLSPQVGWRGASAGYVATQLQQRLMPIVSGERGAEAPLPVTGDIAAVCETKPRLRWLRMGATAALGFVGSLM